MFLSSNFNDNPSDETTTFGPGGSIFDYFSMTCKELAPGSAATPMPTPPGSCRWFVSPTGSFGGNGSIGSPWSLKRLFGGDPGFGAVGPPAAIHPGDNICLRGGTYTGLFQTILAGTPGHQITIMPYPGEHVIIDSASATPNFPNTAVAGVVIGSEGNQFGYVTMRDLEITDSYSTNRQDARPDGVYIEAPGVKLINNIIHDVGNGIFHNTSANDSELHGNLVYNVGWDDRTNGPIKALNFVRSYGYHREGRGTQNFELGYSGTENISATATNNTLIGGINNVDHFETLVFTNNYIATADRLLYYSPPTTNTSITINNNNYYFYPNSAKLQDCAAPFAVINTGVTTAQWRALGLDAGNTYSAKWDGLQRLELSPRFMRKETKICFGTLQ